MSSLIVLPTLNSSAIALQVAQALLYYLAIVALLRMAGKRQTGQTSTLDLILLIALGVVAQSALLEPGRWNAVLFVITVFSAHKATTAAALRWHWVHVALRGHPRVLVRDGQIVPRALEREGLTPADLDAGLRKLGYDQLAGIRVAVLEETGHISVVPAVVDDN